LKWHARLSLFNHFELLDVPEDADRTTILLGFQQAVRRFHPDQLTGEYEPLRPLAREIVSQMGAAYRVLENDATRQQYLINLERSRQVRAARSSIPASRPSIAGFRRSSVPAKNS
jgi:curved DNA-binding protein CbpA